MSTNQIISKVWSFCNTLRDDGVGYGDYLEQLTYLLFLKMADEYSKPPYNRTINIPPAYNWQSLTALRGAELEGHYTVVVNYVGTLLNGTEFDNSVKRGQPVEFKLNQVIKGWTEGLQLMSVGSKYKFYIPYNLAYGLNGNGPIPGGATLVFEVELLNIKPSI